MGLHRGWDMRPNRSELILKKRGSNAVAAGDVQGLTRVKKDFPSWREDRKESYIDSRPQI